jgi:hypothetical protein
LAGRDLFVFVTARWIYERLFASRAAVPKKSRLAKWNRKASWSDPGNPLNPLHPVEPSVLFAIRAVRS